MLSLEHQPYCSSQTYHADSTLHYTYALMHKYNVVWILQTYLDSAVQDNDLSISEYDSIRADHSNNVSHNVCFVRLKGEIM